jgi:hypothetical protein
VNGEPQEHDQEPDPQHETEDAFGAKDGSQGRHRFLDGRP